MANQLKTLLQNNPNLALYIASVSCHHYVIQYMHENELCTVKDAKGEVQVFEHLPDAKKFLKNCGVHEAWLTHHDVHSELGGLSEEKLPLHGTRIPLD